MLLLLSAVDDSPIGRFDPSLLSDLQCVELLYTPNNPKDLRQQLGGNEDDVCSFHGITCDPNDRVQRIRWSSVFIFGRKRVQLHGGINFSFFPRQVQSVTIFNQNVVGTIDLAVLPETLVTMSLQHCKFSGTVDVRSLPRGLKHLYIRHNCFTGIADIVNLPDTIEKLSIEERITQEALHIGKLPDGPLQVALYVKNIPKLTFADPADSAKVELQKRRAKES